MVNSSKLFIIIIGTLLFLTMGCQKKESVVGYDSSLLGRLQFDSESFINFGQVVVNSLNDKEIIVTNPGKFDATDIVWGLIDPTGPFSYLGGEFPGIGGNCGNTLLAGASCKLVVRFLPMESGNFEEVLPVSFANGLEFTNTSIFVRGKAGASANLQTDQAVYLLGAVEPNVSRVVTINITNNGDIAASNVTMNLVSSGGDFTLQGGDCPSIIQGHQSCSVVIRYNSATTGSKSGTLKINFFNGAANSMTPAGIKAISANLEGILGVASEDQFFNYGIVPMNSNRLAKVKFKNVGYAPLEIANVSVSLPFVFAPGSSTCLNRSIAIYEECELGFYFRPTTAGMLVSSGLVINYDGGKGAKVLSLTPFFSGRGLDGAILETNLLSDQAEFPLTGVGAPRTLNIEFTNIGSMKATSLSVNFSGTNSIPSGPGVSVISKSLDSCSSLTPSGQLGAAFKCVVTLFFDPPNTGTYSETLNLSYHNGNEMITMKIPVTGQAIRKANIKLLSVDKTNFLAQSPILNTDLSQPILIKIKNVGSGTARDIDDNIRPPYFYSNTFGAFAGEYPGFGGVLVSDPCPLDKRLLAGQSCTIALSSSYRGGGFNYKYLYELNYDDGIENKVMTQEIAPATMDELQFESTYVFPGKLIDSVPAIHWKFPQIMGNFPVEYDSGPIGMIALVQTGNFPVTLLAYSVAPIVRTGGSCAGAGDDDPNEGMSFSPHNCTTTSPTNILGIGAACGFAVNFNPQCTGVYSSSVTYEYTTAAMYPQTITKTLKFSAVSKALGLLTVTPQDLTITTLSQLPGTGSVVVKNIGLGIAKYKVEPTLNRTVVFNGFSNEPELQILCPGGCAIEKSLQPNEEAIINVKLNTIDTRKYQGTLVFQYDNSDDFLDFDLNAKNDLYNKRKITATLLAEAGSLSFIAIANNAASKHMGLPVPVGETVTVPILIENRQGLETDLSFSFSGSAAARYSSDDPVDCQNLAEAESCTVNITYTATSAGLINSSPASFDVTFWNGAAFQTKSLLLNAETKTQDVFHSGWKSIKSFSDADTSPATVSLQWEDFFTGVNTIHSFMVFRRHGWENFDYNAPLVTGISHLQNSYTDTTADVGTEYYYKVVPVLNGNAQAQIGAGATKDYFSVSSQPFSEIQIITPPQYMSLIHRWEANKKVCKDYLGKTILNTLDHFSCATNALGNTSGKFEIGKHLFVDRYEINTQSGVSDYNEPNGVPRQNFTQAGAWNFCKNVAPTAPLHLNQNNQSATFQKRKILLGLLEYRLVSEFFNYSALSDSGCSASPLVSTGQPTTCVSNYDIYDVVGNGWEWLRDRMYGASNNNAINFDNNFAQDSYLNNLSYTSFAASANVPYSYYSFNTSQCISPILGIPVPCGSDHTSITNTYTYVDSFYQMPIYQLASTNILTGLKAGGPSGGALSKFNLSWLYPDNVTTAGARCSFTH